MLLRLLLLSQLLIPSSCLTALEVKETGRSLELRDDHLSASISKRDGKLYSLKWDDRELIRGGQGYWSVNGGSDSGRASAYPRVSKASITADPADNGGTLARVSIACPATGDPGTLPVNSTFHYALTRDGGGLYCYAEFEHPPELEGFSVGEARYVLKPDPRVFDYIHIDKNRSRPAPTGSDWDHGEPLNMKEVRRLTTGVHKGEVEHKYGYSALFSEAPAYGWCSTQEETGLWMVHPSLESIAGGPTKPELTAHLDVNPGGRPVLLNMWHGSHYGGTSLSVLKGEHWSKVIGPFVLHINHGGSPENLAREALDTAKREAGKWPYPWVDSPLYAADSRKKVSGRIELKRTPEGPGVMWVGLTAPEYLVEGRRGAQAVDWQRDSKHYQYWVKAAAYGTFALPSVRPGDYALHAFREGVLGEFEKNEVSIKDNTDLGTLEWSPERAGPTLWEIGVPDRSAAEFRGGDHYWKWGNYYEYQEIFPNGVDFTIGRSDWKKDWYYCQPPRITPDGRVRGNSTWTVRFTLDEEPTDTILRIALCGFREGGSLRLFVNHRYSGDTGRFQENGVMHRDGIRGHLKVWSFPLPADRLKRGENIFELSSSAREWHQGVLYDYLRLEQVGSPPDPEPDPDPTSPES